MRGSIDSSALVVVATESWRRWLTDFLAGDGVRVDVVYEPGSLDEVTSFLACGRYRAVVFLSHHETLSRNAEWGRELGRTFVGCVVAQPPEVAALAHDKRRMASLASTVSLINPIPELTFWEAARTLRDRPIPLVAKPRSGTEGSGFQVVFTEEQLMAVVDDAVSPYIIQPFIQGQEYSVNLIRVDDLLICFPTVDKGANSTKGIHPSRRLRYCPGGTLAPSTDDRMKLAACLMAENSGVRGICEFEFLVTDDDVIYLVEINPRVAATMRMASLANGSSIFDCLVDASLEENPTLKRTSRKFTAEFAVPLELAGALPTGRVAPDVWVTTRVTIVADEKIELERRINQIRGQLEGALRSSTSRVDRSLFDT